MKARKITAIVLCAIFALAGCQPEPEVPDTGLAGYDPNLIKNAEAACIEDGGRFGKGGLGGSFICYQNMKDANQYCTSASDCEGVCLARSNTCSPVKPLFGCNEVLTRMGARTTLCLE